MTDDRNPMTAFSVAGGRTSVIEYRPAPKLWGGWGTCYDQYMTTYETIPVQFFEAAVRFKDRVAFQIKREGHYVTWSYGQVADQVRHLSASLLRLNIAPRDRVALLSENQPEWCIAYLGIVTAGATATPLDIQLSDKELENLFSHSESRAVVVSEALLPKVHPIIRRLPSPPDLILVGAKAGPSMYSFFEMLQGPGDEPLPSPLPEDLASILYTSGTTGTPKGVMLTHRNFVSNVLSLKGLNVCGPEDNLLALLPLHHSYPFMVTFLTPLLCGARVTFLQSLKPPDLLQCMQETRVTILVAVPQLLALLHKGIFQEVEKRPLPLRTLFYLLLGLAGASREYLKSNPGRVLFAQIHRRFGGKLRLLTSGGAKLDPAVGRDLSRLGFTVLEGYGLTETSPVVTFTPPDRPKFDSVGLPLPGVQVQIIDRELEGAGEIAIQGPNVMKGYFKDPQGTAHAFRDGWFLSGDLGYLDAEGYLFITGRAKEVIVLSSGKNIYPEEVEAHFLRSPYIKEICILGLEVPGAGRVEELGALVIPNIEYLRTQRITNAQDMIRWEMETLARQLPAYKRPTALQIVQDPFPRTRLGKIQRHLIREIYLTGGVPRIQAEEASAPSLTDQPLLESEIAQKILAYLPLIARKKQGIRLEDNLELDLGLDSLARIELLVALEELFPIDLPEGTGSELFTVKDVVLKVQEHVGSYPGVPRDFLEARRPTWGEILKGDPSTKVQEEIVEGQKAWALAVSFLSHVLLRLLFKTLCRLRVFGQEHVPERGPYLITPNHASFIDAFAVGAALPFRILRHLYFLGLQQFFQHPLSAMFGKAYRVIHVDAETYLYQALQAAAYILRQGEILCVFPEGARSIDGQIKPFKKGTTILAKELNLPLLPVRIIGSFEIWPRGKSYPRPHPLTIVFGPPVTGDELLAHGPIPEGEDVYEVLAARLRERVVSLDAPSG